MEQLGKIKFRKIGEFEFKSFKELETLVNDPTSELRLKFKGK